MGKLPRFFVDPDRVNDGRISLADDVVRHAVHTLRMKPGDPLILFDGSGNEYKAALERDGKNYAAAVESVFPGLVQPHPALYLYQAPMKKERWEWLIEKITEIGVSHLIPLMTRFTEVDATQKFEKKSERWEAIARSACEQSGWSTPPSIREPVKFEDALINTPGMKLLFYEKEAPPLMEALAGAAPHDAVSLFVGPEGGFSGEEVELARESGAFIVSLGRQIFRSETAGIVASALIRSRFS